MSQPVDSAMPWLASALDVEHCQTVLRSSVTLPNMDSQSLVLHSARIVRHREGRRCMIEYAVDARFNGALQRVHLLGKVRAKGIRRETLRVMADLWNAGFATDSADEISIPELAGEIPEWRMWLAVKINGPSITECLVSTSGAEYAVRIADVAHKIHESGVIGTVQHGIVDELSILDEALAKASEARPDLANRIREVAVACRELAMATKPGRIAGIHRDFYGDQIVVCGNRLYVLDLDQFSEGDASLDYGNFLAHITEQSLRLHCDPSALDNIRNALLERATQAGASRETIMVYDLLTLARHIWISTRIAQRNSITPGILAECERRIGQYLVTPQ